MLARSLPSRRFNCGSQNIYHFHPRHMLVKKPLNINDEDISHDMRCNEQPLSQPTTMSYQLLQLRLSEISHNMVDRSPLVMGLGGPNHDVVMSIDTELQMLLIDTPSFFSMPVEELISDYHMDSPRASKIAHQGYMFYSQLYAQRCTLHIPYFVRGLTESAYATSSQICLQSACLVIQTESKLRKSRISAARYKFLGFLVPVFMSSIVLLIDSCYHKTSIHARHHREELAEAIRILEEAKHESGTAAKFLDSLTHVLRKHKVTPARQLPTPGPTTAIERQYVELPLPIGTLPGLDGNGFVMGDEMYSNGEGLSTYFAELAQSFGQGNEVADLDWNSMFSGIDSSMTWI
ncbi:hypothetical protein EIK77_002848 [Talaromyces pinophilus]|nr:hypothetical protein EIK77_002848 [Talaromyces pinophilus]